MENFQMDTDLVSLKINNGLLMVTYADELHITLDIAKQMLESRVALTKDQSYPALIDSSRVKGIDKEARSYFSSEEGTKGIVAAALLTDSVFGSFLANFFLSVNFVRPNMPARLFTDKPSAIKWLRQFKNE